VRVLAALGLASCFSPDANKGMPCVDWCPPPERCIQDVCRQLPPDAEPYVEPNIMFVTSRAVPAAMLGTREFADSTCQSAADQKLPGVYKAWLSGQLFNARSAVQNASGWIRPDGKPFANTLTDLLAGKVFYPPCITEEGDDICSGDEDIATGTRYTGDTGSYCETGGFIQVGRSDGGTDLWTDYSDAMCSEMYRIYCFGVDRRAHVGLLPPTASQKTAFLTRVAYPRKSLADADAICRMEGGGNHVALLATKSASARARVAGTALSGAWYRTDGVRLTTDMHRFDVPLDITVDGEGRDAKVWFGAMSLDDLATNNCNDWSSSDSAIDTLSGKAALSTRDQPFTGGDATGCDENRYFYCAEPD
jgi:hypothetical protein